MSHLSRAQDSLAEDLKRRLVTAKTDTARINRLIDLSASFSDGGQIESLQYADEALKLAQKIKYVRGIANAQLALGRAYSNIDNYEKATAYLAEASSGFNDLGDSLGLARALSRLGWVSTQRGDYAVAFELGQQSLRMAQKYNDQLLVRRTLSHLGALHTLLGDYDLALDYTTQVMDMYDQANDLKNVCRTLNSLGELYRLQGDPEKAESYYDKSIRMAEALNNTQLKAQAESNMAAVQTEMGRHKEAIETAHRALRELLARGQFEVISWTQTVMARAQLGINRPDSAVFYGQRSWNLSRQIGYKEVIRDASSILSSAYARQNNYRQAYLYQQSYIAYNDTLSGSQTRQQLTILQQNAKAAEQQAAAALQAEEDSRQQQRLIGALIGLGLLGIVAVVLWRNNQRQIKTNEQLRQQQAELKAAQTQLIQQEKLASLGELTAGIAHEIQNPLNFVNNFSEVSAELVTELREEREKGQQRDEGLELELLEDLAQNLQKINHHGGRASSIVKGMLQHSRTSTGQREPTDINALADEYLKLAYHGLRAKDKTFNARFELLPDPAIGKVSVVPQDLGRVLLNLFNNGFYATQKRLSEGPPSVPAKVGQPNYQPILTVHTERTSTGVRIRVSDNGAGMSDAVRQKIFQPFFTTKPTGEGTGLGLSLAYEIITKGHNGTINVESAEGEGTTFIIELPA